MQLLTSKSFNIALLHFKCQNLLQADFSVSSSGETYCAVPTKELALAGKTNHTEQIQLGQTASHTFRVRNPADNSYIVRKAKNDRLSHIYAT